MDSILNNFKTFAYHPDYALLIFLCTKFKFFYEIYLENDIVKYIDLNSELFKFYTWQEFVLSNEYSSIVDDNFSFYEEPNYSSNEITFIRKQDEIFFITGIQVINDWLKVKVEYPNTEETTFGWIKWRNQENILIDFYFLL